MLRLRQLEKSLLSALNESKGRLLDDDRYVTHHKGVNKFRFKYYFIQIYILHNIQVLDLKQKLLCNNVSYIRLHKGT